MNCQLVTIVTRHQHSLQLDHCFGLVWITYCICSVHHTHIFSLHNKMVVENDFFIFSYHDRFIVSLFIFKK